MTHEVGDTWKGVCDVLCEKANDHLYDQYNHIFMSNLHSCVNLVKSLYFSKLHFFHLLSYICSHRVKRVNMQDTKDGT